ncbi:DUF342 domain-containing protein [Desulfovibrio psychrotolerans]|uniref:Flagellar Assembly Protein A N-terminal region domain-containing protein n=1 Tax=Desulfovibrio psychrotolerans TaxID=415242 RepID=A0A7J0BV30_9BACT|nr:FapA family protein [Desulfovibrio psychrotolerans]GFM37560.1 hypothetical protein DSM19430T_22440 [Desulfovibrio psychrotolerans]
MSARNADIEIIVSDDGLAAIVSGFTIAGDGGAPFTMQTLSNALARAGIKAPPDKEAAKHLLSAFSAGETPDEKAVLGTVIARGVPPKRAEDASIKPLGDLSRPVLPGDAFCEIVQAKPATDGISVSGTSIRPAGPPMGKSLAFPESPNCFIDTTSLQIRSETYGLVVFEDSTLHVRPLLQVAKGDMQVFATVYPKTFRDRNITAEHMESALKEMGITAPPDHQALSQALEAARTANAEVTQVSVARGLEPINGKNGWFELYVKDERSGVGQEDEEGNIDFRARGVIRSVPVGAAVGKLHAPTRGIPGKDVYGRVIPAHDGAVFPISLGENVSATETGSEFIADITGMVFFIRNTLSVTEVFTTASDVNMTTGNLLLEKGSVHVRGSVLSGFRIDCPRNVLVDEVVESAVINAGGDVQVRGGIIMDREGRITAQGGVSAMFAKGATVEAQGDVNIAHEMINCVIFAGQNVVATKGRGKIVGSTVRCGGSVIANEIGSELGVPTTIFLGLEAETTDYSQRRRELKALLQKIYGSLGTGDPRTILVNTPPGKREAVAQVLKLRLSAEKELREIDACILCERAEQRKAMQSKLKAQRVIYPGTVVHAYGAIFRVTAPLERSQLVYDPDEQKIVVMSL